MSSSTFCLDMGEHYLKVADIEQKKRQFNAKSIAYNELPFNLFATTAADVTKKSTDFLMKLLSDATIKKKEVNIVIPDSQSYTRIFEMPMLTDKELMSAIKYQADQFIPIPIDKVSLDIHILKKDKKENKTLILLVAAPMSIIENVVKITENAGLLPETIENETTASLRLISELNQMHEVSKGERKGVDIYINFGNSSSSIYLLDNQQLMPLQVHNFSIGRDIFYRDIKSNFSLKEDQIKHLIEEVGFAETESQYDLNQILSSPLNELVSEVKRFLISSKEGVSSSVQHIYLFGEGSKFAGIEKKLSSLLGVQIMPFNMTEYFKKNTVSEYFVNDWPLLIPVIGGSLR